MQLSTNDTVPCSFLEHFIRTMWITIVRQRISELIHYYKHRQYSHSLGIVFKLVDQNPNQANQYTIWRYILPSHYCEPIVSLAIFCCMSSSSSKRPILRTGRTKPLRTPWYSLIGLRTIRKINVTRGRRKLSNNQRTHMNIQTQQN